MEDMFYGFSQKSAKEDKQGKVENKELERGKNWKGARSRLEEATGGCGKNEKVRIIGKARSYSEGLLYTIEKL